MTETTVWLSPQEAAERVGVSRSTLYRWEAEGRIKPPPRTPTGQRRYDQAEVDSWLKESA